MLTWAVLQPFARISHSPFICTCWPLFAMHIGVAGWNLGSVEASSTFQRLSWVLRTPDRIRDRKGAGVQERKCASSDLRSFHDFSSFLEIHVGLDAHLAELDCGLGSELFLILSYCCLSVWWGHLPQNS